MYRREGEVHSAFAADFDPPEDKEKWQAWSRRFLEGIVSAFENGTPEYMHPYIYYAVDEILEYQQNHFKVYFWELPIIWRKYPMTSNLLPFWPSWASLGRNSHAPDDEKLKNLNLITLENARAYVLSNWSRIVGYRLNFNTTHGNLPPISQVLDKAYHAGSYASMPFKDIPRSEKRKNLYEANEDIYHQFFE